MIIRNTALSLGLAVVLTAFASPVFAEAGKIKGRAEVSYFKQTDDNTNYQFNVLRSRLRLEGEGIVGEKNDLNLDLSYRNASTDYNSDIPQVRIQEANVKMREAFGTTDLSLGRIFVNNVPGARVDGVHAESHTGEQSGFGAFGGLQPNPIKDTIGTEFLMFGAYGYHRTKDLGLSGGAASTRYKGKEDSTFLYLQGDYKLGENTTLYGSSRADRRIKGGNGFDLSNVILSVNHRIGRKAQVGASVAQYQAYQLYESLATTVSREIHRSYRVNGTYRMTNTASVYGNAGMQVRGGDHKSATNWTAGIRDNRLFDSDVNADLSYRNATYYTGKNTAVRAAVGTSLFGIASLNVNYEQLVNSQDDQTRKLVQNIYGIDLNVNPTKQIYVIVQYQSQKQTYQDVPDTFAAITPDAWSSSSIFLMAGYRF